jgi:hypothetical protein
MPAPDPLTYINLGPQGTFRSSGRVSTSPADVDAIVAHLRTRTPAKLAIHFHGGLNNESAGIEIANKMGQLFKEAGCHPVSFVWETGVFETLRANLGRIHDTKLFKKLLTYALRWGAAKLGLDIGGRGPGAPIPAAEVAARIEAGETFGELDAITGARGGEVLSDAALESLEDELTTELETDFESDPEMPTVLDEAPAEGLRLETSFERARGVSLAAAARFIAGIVVGVVRRHMLNRDHGLYTTVVEEILRRVYLAELGEFLWSGMKGKAEAMWDSNAGLVGDDLHGGRYFLEALAALQQSRRELTIDLVGHSAGSIAVCGMLDAAAALPVAPHFRNVVFLAPAARIDRFERGVMNRAALFDDFRMFTMTDDLEKQDQLFPPIYVRSLLYLVSGCFEAEADAEICGMQRFFGANPPFASPLGKRLGGFLRSPGQGRLVLSTTDAAAPSGFRSQSTKHGAFDDDASTRDSIRSILG